MASVCQVLIDAQAAPAPESKPAKKGPRAVPAAKSKRRRKAA
jgi:hypothetical protein